MFFNQFIEHPAFNDRIFKEATCTANFAWFWQFVFPDSDNGLPHRLKGRLLISQTFLNLAIIEFERNTTWWT